MVASSVEPSKQMGPAVLVDDGEITQHASVADAQAAVQREYDQMYGTAQTISWRWDRLDEQWYGYLVDTEHMVTVKVLAGVVTA